MVQQWEHWEQQQSTPIRTIMTDLTITIMVTIIMADITVTAIIITVGTNIMAGTITATGIDIITAVATGHIRDDTVIIAMPVNTDTIEGAE